RDPGADGHADADPDAVNTPPRPTPPTVALPQPPQQNSPVGGVPAPSGQVDKMYPAVSGNNVIWVSNDSMNRSVSVQLCDIPSGNNSTISTPPASVPPLVMPPRQLAIAENNAVWSGTNPQTGRVNIYLYDIATGRLQQVTKDEPGTPLDPPGVSQDYIIWTNLTGGSGDVDLYRIAGGTATPLVTAPSYQMETAIGGNTTAWVDNTTGGDFDIVISPSAGREESS
ncbi:hypothetical protein, partial [Methanoculleus chikugoensis]|uniref:TolB family protein n=1 Tax=Methanoculleus chikugoensis TaxID=118126 RepID=UPI000A713B79